MLKIAITAVVTAMVTSTFWILVYAAAQCRARAERNGVGGRRCGDGQARPAHRPSRSPKGVEVGPAGLAIPVVGIKPNQLTDTFTQARAGGASACTTRSTSWRRRARR